MDYAAAAARLQDRIDQVSRITEVPGEITRTYLSPAMREANNLVCEWMNGAGFSGHVDSAGNARGWFQGPEPDSPVLLTGSHLDTVRDAGRFDGPLGVLLPIVAVEMLRKSGWQPPFSILNFGFADEEGVRFQIGCLGSKAVTGRLTEADLALRDRDGRSLREVIEEFSGAPLRLPELPSQLMGYIEVHIEQGPELARWGHPLAIVTGINAQTRLRVNFRGEAGHAGTVPMLARRDAFAGLAEFAWFLERYARTTRGLVATIGDVRVRPGAGNVIPAIAEFSIDVRHALRTQVESACSALEREARRICEVRRLECEWAEVDAMPAVEFSESLTRTLCDAALASGYPVMRLRSGAGHDAMVLADVCPAAMLFVRCRDGVSHHPSEYVSIQDMEAALKVYCEFLRRLRP